jgi:hypothetical protein
MLLFIRGGFIVSTNVNGLVVVFFFEKYDILKGKVVMNNTLKNKAHIYLLSLRNAPNKDSVNNFNRVSYVGSIVLSGLFISEKFTLSL